MKGKALGLGALVTAVLTSATPAAAQELELGTWTGLMSPPQGEGVPVTYQVARTAGDLSIVMNNVQLGDIPFTDPRLEGDQLTFWWEPGTRVDCTLSRQASGAFEGSCSAGNGEGAITMVPPTE
ncbi:MAG: hypothetical protein OEO79_11210 [Gemmatimonadota bacterium]|nr:hypothetical protein [Gemmatimonadota bacterium]MDH3422729.1 hypothetical protein [Gemmatimonadota bacterium]